MKTLLLLGFLAAVAYTAVTVKFVNSSKFDYALTQVFSDGAEYINVLSNKSMICMHLTDDGVYKFHQGFIANYMIVIETTQSSTTFHLSAVGSHFEDSPLAITPLKDGVPCGKSLVCEARGCRDACYSDDDIKDKTRTTNGDEIEVNWNPEIPFKGSKICPKTRGKVRENEETSVYDYY